MSLRRSRPTECRSVRGGWRLEWSCTCCGWRRIICRCRRVLRIRRFIRLWIRRWGLMCRLMRWAALRCDMRLGRVSAAVALVACFGLVSAAVWAATGDVNPTGVWKVVDYFATDPATGAVTHPFGEKPIGSAIYTAKGHMSVLVAGSHRVPSTGAGAKRAQERAELFDGLYAYSGTYTVKGNA